MNCGSSVEYEGEVNLEQIGACELKEKISLMKQKLRNFQDNTQEHDTQSFDYSEEIEDDIERERQVSYLESSYEQKKPSKKIKYEEGELLQSELDSMESEELIHKIESMKFEIQRVQAGQTANKKQKSKESSPKTQWNTPMFFGGNQKQSAKKPENIMSESEDAQNQVAAFKPHDQGRKLKHKQRKGWQ